MRDLCPDGIRDAHLDDMAQQRPPARSYEAITRATVPDLDSSWRPTEAQERGARDGVRVLSIDEDVLAGRISEALAASGLEARTIQVEVAGTRVTLRGQVLDVQRMPEIDAIVAAVEGVTEVVDLLVVAAP